MRAATPDILGVVMAGPVAEIAAALRYDYSQLGADGAAVREHAIQIKVNERRANDAVVEAGRHLIAVRASLPHGKWEDWLQVEFHMSDRTARTMMSVAERFDGKTEMISDLSSSVLGLLASPSVPDAAVEAVIDANANGKVTVPQAKQIIRQHKPARLFVQDLKGIVVTWHANEWRRDWPENPSHTNGAFWREITAWMHANITDAWQEGDLKEAIKAVHASATRQPRTEPPAGYTVPEAVADKPLPAWVDDPVAAKIRQDGLISAIGHVCDGQVDAVAQEIISCLINGDRGWYHDLLLCYTDDASADEWKIAALKVRAARQASALHFDPSDDRTWELRRLETRIELIIRQLKDQEKEYGRLTGDFTTALEARRGMERMVATLRRNQGLDE